MSRNRVKVIVEILVEVDGSLTEANVGKKDFQELMNEGLAQTLKQNSAIKDWRTVENWKETTEENFVVDGYFTKHFINGDWAWKTS
jgi:hypothetical protein